MTPGPAASEDPAPATARTILEVALPLPLPGTFCYLPPAGDGSAYWLGCRVRVPFGPRELIGIVVGENSTGPEGVEPRAVLERIDAQPLLDGELAGSLAWAAGYYHRPIGEVYAAALPGPLREGRPVPPTRAFAWRLTAEGRQALARMRAGTRTRALAERLARGTQAEPVLDAQVPRWREPMRRLAARALVERCMAPVDLQADLPMASGPGLNPAQRDAVEAIRSHSGFRVHLLDGVTGSGKTEVYLAAVAHCLARGRQALVLVPEIGLTPQALARFGERLPVPVHAFHSALAEGERARVFAACFDGQARVVVGTRSAVLLPLPEAGLIVVDEEHDASYKQQEGWRYHARDLALVRARNLQVPVVLGSATPSLESLHNAMTARYDHLRLRQRAGQACAPVVRLHDLRGRRLQHGLAPALLEAIDARLARGEQVLVFRNRRGYAPALLCHDCGWHARCRRCDAALTVHGRGARLQCHHCGARQSVPSACPDCGGLALQPQGAGTERLEQALAERFPAVPLVRVDRETTRGRDALARHFARLGEGAGILVGTQMLAKGHDLPRLTLVAVIGVDEGLFSADFRAPERLAQLLVQVSGRAGRADLPGEVWLQTHHPEHPLLATLLAGGYHAFAELALAEREAAGLPPFAHLALLRAEAPRADALDAFLAFARAACPLPRAVELHGPMPAPMPRRQGRVRGQLLLSARDRAPLHACLRAWLPLLHASREARRVRWSIDVDPVDLY
ncbi:MAG TPA: primosomal protein N' [Xanthomonadaceae bacterium]|nr:primosomal protein N' [Xanthomonadaceae bacterium]